MTVAPIFASDSRRTKCDWILDRRAVEADDDVARPQAGGVGIRSLLHADDDHAVRIRRAELLGQPGRERLQRDAGDRAALDFAVT